MTESLIIRGGHVVTATDTFRADVLIADGKIAALGVDDGWTADRVIDADGHYVLPGGIDTHTHFEHHNLKGTTRTADDFRTGSAASAAGGTTTFVDFVRGLPGESLIDAFHRRRTAAEEGSMIDFGFHLMVPATANSDDSFDQLRQLTEEFGATSWKFFMAYTGLMVPDDVLIRGFTEAKALGVLPMVHAENGHMVNAAVDALIEEGKTEEHHHMHGHPAAAEREAIVRAATIAEWVDTPLFIVHVSSADGVGEIQALQSRGRPVFGETCPHYLVTGYEDYSQADFEAAKYICSPPIRESSHQEPLWNALATGVLGSVGTDHATYTMDQPEDLPPQKPQGRGFFPNVPPGVPGAEERLMVLYEHGVARGRFDLNRFVDMTSTNPAKTFGLYPRKGTIAPGSDADVVIWDPQADHTISADRHRSRAGYTLYEGMSVSGAPRHVFSRGQQLVRDGELVELYGHGRYQPRTTLRDRTPTPLPADRSDSSLPIDCEV
ncbi:dihydropyrimidinase [Gordonia metallireducens]|uniref:dihydropyrimidinase n=1 Tax=Gordonia metallireducens TaxID=2897779 RepID=UPI001E3DEC51|nr:dihydropyrimidinase [Gordonia metallireducens]